VGKPGEGVISHGDELFYVRDEYQQDGEVMNLNLEIFGTAALMFIALGVIALAQWFRDRKAGKNEPVWVAVLLIGLIIIWALVGGWLFVRYSTPSEPMQVENFTAVPAVYNTSWGEEPLTAAEAMNSKICMNGTIFYKC
jgi:hypothetical protein